MQQYKKNLGKVSLTAEGKWNIKNAYPILSIVYDEHTQHGFVSKKDVPENIDLNNNEYWMPLNVSGYADNNIIILSEKTSENTIKEYTLKEAIQEIASVGRKPGAILCFYNANTDRLDIGGRWEIWQFNSTTISEWENVESWQNIYYNYNKFVGWYKNENMLKQYNPFPEIGCYAFVGTKLNEATIYKCETKYIWTDTTQHSWDYVKVIVEGNVTIGENGNWFSNGVDTNIPASIKGENGKTPVFRNNNNVIEVSYDNVEWNAISDEIAAWFRWQSEGGQQAKSAGKIQITRDGITWTDLSGQFVNNLHISRYIGIDESLPTSNIAEGTIYAKGPTYAEDDTLNNNPIYRLWVYAWKGDTLAWQDNGEFQSIAAGVVQETGDSETLVMSQKAVTTLCSKIDSKIDSLASSFELTENYIKEKVVNRVGVSDNANGAVTDYIKVEPNTTYTIYTGGTVETGALVIYDENKNYIDYFSMTISERDVTTTETTKYIRLTLNLANIDDCYLKHNNKIVWSPYRYIDPEAARKDDFDRLQKGVTELMQSFDKNLNCIEKKAVNYTSGLVDNDDACATDFVRVEPNTEYSIYTGSNTVTGGSIVYYDSSKNKIDWVSMTQTARAITTPNNAAYIRFTVYAEDVNDCYLKKGDEYVWTPSRYIEKDVVRTEEFNEMKKDVEDLHTITEGNFELTKNYTSNMFVNIYREDTSETGAITDFISIKPQGQYEIFTGGTIVEKGSIVFYNNNKEKIDFTSMTVTVRTITAPDGAYYLRATMYEPNIDNCYIRDNGVDIWKPYKYSVVQGGGVLSSLKGTTIVAIGDSVTEFKGEDGKRYSDWIEEYSGATVINIGIGGTRIYQRTTPVTNPTTSNEAYAALDIVNLVKTVTSDKSSELWTRLANAMEYVKNNAGDNNDAVYGRITNIDWSKVNVVTIFAGGNDWSSGKGLGTSGSEDANYTLGAINLIIKTLLTKYPHIHLYWFTPTVKWKAASASERTDANFSDTLKNDSGITIAELSQKIYEEVHKNHIPVCDMYNTLGWTKYNFSQYFADNDGTHPKDMKPIARKMIAFIESNRTF